ncbi:Tyrosine-protein phosphatase non-receptor type 12 [Halotydeus destructor]|nr:Tyrosine-protein phosphatase non-receptor type 12 [Halotydeus destructor]
MGKASLKHVLRKFLADFEDLEKRKKNSEEDVFHREFHSLKELTENSKTDPNYSCSEGLKDVNRRKNRYKDILPYDYTRVVISEYPGVPGSDFINANYVKGSTGSTRAYIASQGPLPNTLVDFWRLIWECEVTLIVMACNERESGKYKCESYWPPNCDEVEQYGNITVKLVKWRQVCPDFLVRTLQIDQDGVERTVCQFHYTTWPDHSVPPHVLPILELIRLMRDVQATETRPILIHCSAGCGRTGTICSIDYVWALLRSGKLNEDFNLYSIIREMRKQRIAMVQTYEQYVLCYRAVAALFRQQLKIIDAHTYENLDEDGQPLLFRSVDDDARTSSGTDSSEERSSYSGKSLKSDQSIPNPVEIVLGAHHTPDSEDNDSPLFIEPEPSYSADTSFDFKQEKLVGKATVIRRPSIAKLKAMFEGVNMNQDASRRSAVRRSQSTKERSRPLSALRHASISDYDDVFLRNNAAVVSEIQSIYGTKQKPNESETSISPNLPSQLFMPGPSKVLVPTNHSTEPTYGQLPPRPSSQESDNITNAPPKPPRTFEHNVNRNARLARNVYPGVKQVVRVAATTVPKLSSNDDRTANDHRAYQLHISTPNLAIAAPHFSVPNPNLVAYPIQRLSDTDLSRSSQTTNIDQSYRIKQDNGQTMNRTSPSHAIYGPIGMKSSFPFPTSSLLGNQRKFVPSGNVIPMQRRPGVVMNQRPRSTHEPIYNVLPGRQQMTSNVPLRRPNIPIVTYVRPQTNSRIQVRSTPNMDNRTAEAKPIAKVANNVATANVQPVPYTSQDNLDKEVKKEKPSKNNQASPKKNAFSIPFFGKSKQRPKRKSDKVHAVVQNPQSHLQINTNPVNGTIRPPHSHRFSPPAQWTQV